MEVAVAMLGIGFTLLAFIITYLAWRNGKIIKENTKIVIDKIDELGQKMDEGFRELRKEIRELGEKIDQGFRLIALLILAETPEEKKELAKRILGKKD
jgi:hypothetical protein